MKTSGQNDRRRDGYRPEFIGSFRSMPRVQKTKKQTKKQTNDWEGGEEEETNVTAKSCFKRTQ